MVPYTVSWGLPGPTGFLQMGWPAALTSPPRVLCKEEGLIHTLASWPKSSRWGEGPLRFLLTHWGPLLEREGSPYIHCPGEVFWWGEPARLLPAHWGTTNGGRGHWCSHELLRLSQYGRGAPSLSLSVEVIQNSSCLYWSLDLSLNTVQFWVCVGLAS